jgi:hypothetical protein
MLGGDVMPGIYPNVMPLDEGPAMMLTGPRGTKTLSSIVNGYSISVLGASVSNGILPSTLFLDPGSYTLKGFGGQNVGAFTTNFNIPSPPTWTNRDTTNVVTRSQGLTVSWTGGDPTQTVAIIGYGDDLPSNSSAMFACIAPPGSNSFTVPPDMLANLPVTRPNPLQSKDVIYMLTLSNSSRQNLAASGLDLGINAFYSVNGKTVVLQ